MYAMFMHQQACSQVTPPTTLIAVAVMLSQAGWTILLRLFVTHCYKTPRSLPTTASYTNGLPIKSEKEYICNGLSFPALFSHFIPLTQLRLVVTMD